MRRFRITVRARGVPARSSGFEGVGLHDVSAVVVERRAVRLVEVPGEIPVDARAGGGALRLAADAPLHTLGGLPSEVSDMEVDLVLRDRVQR